MKKISLLITGASTGIGAACAVYFAKMGHQVFAGVRKASDGEALKKLAPQIQPVLLDVQDKNTILQAKEKISGLREQKLPFCLMNNAGIAVGGPWECVSEEDFFRQMDINVLGIHRVTRGFLPWIRESKGRILQTSSIAGRIASPFLGPYCVSKWGVEAFTDSLRREMQMHGVKVASLNPGPVQTPIWEKSKKEGEKQKQQMQLSLEIYQPTFTDFEAKVEQAARDAVPVEEVVKAAAHALLSESPRSRYFVGKGIGIAALLARFLPDPWMDRLVKKDLGI